MGKRVNIVMAGTKQDRNASDILADSIPARLLASKMLALRRPAIDFRRAATYHACYRR